MAAITAALVKELRERTGLGMMECKKALVASEGDIEKAIEELRKSGQAKAAKKAGRTAAEGIVATKVAEDGSFGVMVEVNSETDFVARDDNFLGYVQTVLDAAFDRKEADVAKLMEGELEEARLALVQKIGENIGITVIKDGYHGDTSKMFLVGNVQPYAEKLVNVTQECLYKGIEIVKPGVRLSDIGRVIAQHAHANHYSVVEEFCGHGIGKVFHEDPQVLHYDGYGDHNDYVLREGMTFTIEPMINAGKKFTKLLGDGWTAVTKDRRPSAQWEHTILVTADGVEVLTLRSEETLPF